MPTLNRATTEQTNVQLTRLWQEVLDFAICQIGWQSRALLNRKALLQSCHTCKPSPVFVYTWARLIFAYTRGNGDGILLSCLQYGSACSPWWCPVTFQTSCNTRPPSRNTHLTHLQIVWNHYKYHLHKLLYITFWYFLWFT